MATICPECETKVLPRRDGTCPACHAPLDPDRAAAPAAKAPAVAIAATQRLKPAEHALLRMLLAGVEVMLNPDSDGHRRAIAALLERFRRGEIVLDGDGDTVTYAELTREERERFTMEHVLASHHRYLARMSIGRR